MKAIVYTEYGPPDVLRLQEVEKPAPKPNEVLIKVCASTVTTGDCNLRGFMFVPPGFGIMPRLMFGIRKPKKTILGTEFSGEIEAVGSEVTKFKAGDQVFGIDSSNLGSYAEYVCRAEERALSIKPANLTYEESAAIPFGAGTALYFLRDIGHVQSGQKVLIIGASGGVGSYAVQLAKYLGAEVTGVCSTANVELVRTLGADKVIDYIKEDFASSGESFDLILDTVCGQTSFARCKPVLKERGIYMAVAGGLREVGQMMWTSMFGRKKVIIGTPPERKEELLFLKELAEAGVIKPVIDRMYPLEQAADAHRYVDSGRKKGNVVITIGRGDSITASEGGVSNNG